MHQNNEPEIDYTKAAAHHLREKASQQGLKIGSSHAHALVAASLGYKSRAALLDNSSNHLPTDQWLSHENPDTNQIRDAIKRMRDTNLTEEHVPFLAKTILDGLTPPCCETGIISAENIPLGNVNPGDEAEWVHPSCSRNTDTFGHCRCCGEGVLYRLQDLDDQMLCAEHHGEFDMDPEEQAGWDDLVENLTK